MIKIISTLQSDLGLREKDYYIWSNDKLREIYESIGKKNDIVIDEEFFRNSPVYFNNRIIVFSNNKLDKNYDVICYDKIDELVYNYYENKKDIYVIGGSEIYKEFLPFVDELYFYLVEGTDKCTEFFPHLKPKEWRMNETTYIEDNIVYEKYVRRKVKK